MLVLSKKEIMQTISMRTAIQIMADAFAQLAKGQAVLPVRTPIHVAEHGGDILFMPAYLAQGEGLGVKIVAVYPNNRLRNLPTIYGLIVLNDAETGAPLAVMDAGFITALRTGAVSGVATDLLARRDARQVAVFGAGKQARTQLAAVCEVRPIAKVVVYDPDAGNLKGFLAEMQGLYQNRGMQIQAATSPAAALDGAEIIIAATTTRTPLFDGKLVGAGVHINGVGSYTPEMQEIDATIVQKAKIVVDSREAVLEEAGDLIIPLREGLISETALYAELGELVVGRKPARENEQEITFFKSVGIAIQDIAVAGYVYRVAREMGLGTEVPLS